jgi:hypothetical protein
MAAAAVMAASEGLVSGVEPPAAAGAALEEEEGASQRDARSVIVLDMLWGVERDRYCM